MSGIFGVISAPGAQVVDAELAGMAQALRHRGPAGVRHITLGNAGLGHCLLHCTPESLHENQPLRDAAAGLTIVADARIDNRAQLLNALGITDRGRGVVTDSELILRTYLKWGADCVDHLLGDFAFAVWDERALTLFVARDPMGCKPFYYHCRDGLFVFASSAMAVARVPRVKATLNEGRVADYLLGELEGVNKSCSWYKEINRMPPANCGYFRNDRFRYRQYWCLEPADLSHLKTDEDYLGAFTDVYMESVGCRLRSQNEPASMLSGGLDSSTIVALAGEILAVEGKPPLRTFSAISVQGEVCPETRSIEAILAQGNLNATCLSPDSIGDHAAGLDLALADIEDPFDGSWTLLALMNLSAAQAGATMMLTGLDGDYAVGAPTSYIALLQRQGRWRSAWTEARGFSRHYYRGDYSARVLFANALRSCLVPAALRESRARLGAPRRYRRLVAAHALEQDFAARARVPDRVREYDSGRALRGPLTLPAWHSHTLQAPDLTVAIERYERLGGYFGLEMRHPLLDIRLLRFSAALPLRQRVRGGWSKYILRRLANGRLPHSVAWREGWEQLGWQFTAGRAEQRRLEGSLPAEAVKERLSPYLKPRPLGYYHGNATGAAPAEELMEMWRHYCLSQWIHSERV